MIETGLVLTQIGLILVIGLVGAKILKVLHIPQVLGFILIGLIIGIINRNLVSFVNLDTITNISSVWTTIALGIIGFNIGAELSLSTLKKMDKKMFALLLADTIGTFLIVTSCVFLLTNLSIYSSLILGALASATAPATTTEVLWDYKASGLLTSAVLIILAIDDIVSILLVQISKSITPTTTESVFRFSEVIIAFGREIGVALVIGLSFGLIVVGISNRLADEGEILEIIIGAIILLIGMSIFLHYSTILAAIVFGSILSSYAKVNLDEIFHKIYKFGIPVVALFFIFVGIKIQFQDIMSIGVIGVVYLASRVVGKVGGVSLTAKAVKAPKVIQKYLGPSLISQAGVALGLAASIQLDFQGTLFEAEGQLILATITGTVVILEIIGPILVKWSIEKADECYKKEGAVCEDENDIEKPSVFVPPAKKTILNKAKSRRFSASYFNYVNAGTKINENTQTMTKDSSFEEKTLQEDDGRV